MEDESRFQINMPANVKVTLEIINRIRIKEMITTAIACIVAVFIALIFNTIFNNYLIALGIWIVITGATFISVMKDKYNTCIAELISNMFKFYQKQRVFHYVVKEEQL